MNDSHSNDSVVSLDAMRRELLSKNRLSPIVAARARLSAIREKAGPAGKVLIPFFQAAAVLCYLDHTRDIEGWQGVRDELARLLMTPVIHVVDAPPADAPMPLFVELSEPAFEKIAMFDFTEMALAMAPKFIAELERQGYEYV